MFKSVLFFFLSVFLFSAYGEKNKIIIKNENVQAVSATALVPSKSKKMRNAREEAEVHTESIIIQKLEAERLRDEQKRISRLLPRSKKTTTTITTTAQNSRSTIPSSSTGFDMRWLNRAYLSFFGIGMVSYPQAENINSLAGPSYFFSFGGYGYGNFIFDIGVSYSEHYIVPVTKVTDNREGLSQPAIFLSTKFSPLKGRIKPYSGLSGSLVFRRWFITDKQGAIISDSIPDQDIAIKKWRHAMDAGVAIGADIALGNKLGLNIDLKYHWNLYTETRDFKRNDQVQILDKRNSLIASGNLRYYF